MIRYQGPRTLMGHVLDDLDLIIYSKVGVWGSHQRFYFLGLAALEISCISGDYGITATCML